MTLLAGLVIFSGPGDIFRGSRRPDEFASHADDERQKGKPTMEMDFDKPVRNQPGTVRGQAIRPEHSEGDRLTFGTN
ncbi:hypothetical protein [Parasphingorhabdus pacifica]